MPTRAFVPAPLVEAEPRVFKSFRGRQLKGITLGACGAAVILATFGVQDFTGYALAFLATLPGFAYGYYHPQGKPVEYWVRVWVLYYLTPRLMTSSPSAARPRWRLFLGQITPVLKALPAVIRHTWRRRKEHKADGR